MKLCNVNAFWELFSSGLFSITKRAKDKTTKNLEKPLCTLFFIMKQTSVFGVKNHQRGFLQKI